MQHCKFTETFAGKVKVQIRIDPDARDCVIDAAAAAMTILENDKDAEKKIGIAPRSRRERTIAARLEAMSKKA